MTRFNLMSSHVIFYNTLNAQFILSNCLTSLSTIKLVISFFLDLKAVRDPEEISYDICLEGRFFFMIST